MSEYFPSISKIKYEGPDSDNPLAFHHYNPDEEIGGKTMRDHMRFGAAYWHCMRALARVPVFFEFLEKIDIDHYCFHDRDISPEGETLAKTHEMFHRVVDELETHQKQSGKKLLWGTACLFSHPRYAQGASTSPSADVFAYGASQVKNAIDATHRLGGPGYTFWGGREGYGSLINTDMKREVDHLAALPKPREPSTHQYDADSATCLNFLREYDLLDHFKLNIETNHATLAGHTMEHELEVAIGANALGSIDANRGDELLGWDTDQFPTNLYGTTNVMLRLLKMGGFTTGGLNFDAKRRRESHEPEDLFHAHIGGMDAFARGLKIADKIIADGRFDEFVKTRYSSYDSGVGADIESGKASLESLSEHALEITPPQLASGRQERLENLLNDYL